MLTEIAEDILKLFTDSVDIKKLQESIVRSVQADIDPFGKQSILFACDIDQLKPNIQQFVS